MNARGRRGLILDDDRILITGGTGLIGTNLANALKKKSHEVLAIGSQFDLRNPIDASSRSGFNPNPAAIERASLSAA